jgi:hypothetical protein
VLRFGKAVFEMKRFSQLLIATAILSVLSGCGGSGGSAGTAGPQIIVCSSTYALCTTAPCTAIEDQPGFASCTCDVTTGYSAAINECSGVQNTSQGQMVVSRYFPIKTYLRCKNDRPWSMCLDSPCIIDPNNPSQAACKCMIQQDQGPYIIVNADGDYSGTTCEQGVNSYATVVDVSQITHYLKTHNTPLKPFPIKVFKPSK